MGRAGYSQGVLPGVQDADGVVLQQRLSEAGIRHGRKGGMNLKVTVWNNTYDNQWSGMIVSEAFSHPAKFSPGLIQKIYAYGIESGWFKPGDVVADCFGGIGGGGIFAAYARLKWIGVELEQRFTDLANQNFDLHRPAWRAHGYPEPVIVQGDSRRFAEIVGECAAICTSPPFVDCNVNIGDVADTPGMRQEISSRSHKRDDSYGHTPGQIGRLKAGELAAVVTSPPFGEAQQGAGLVKRNSLYGHKTITCGYKQDAHGSDPSNIGNLKMDGIVKKGLQKTTESSMITPKTKGGCHAGDNQSLSGRNVTKKDSGKIQQEPANNPELAKQGRDKNQGRGQPGEVGFEKERDRVSLLQKENEPRADSGILRNGSSGNLESNEATRNENQGPGSGGYRTPPVQGRQEQHEIQNVNCKGRMLEMRRNEKTVHSPQERGSLRQHAIEPSGFMLELPQSDNSERILEGKETLQSIVTSPPFTQGYQSGGGINKNGYGENGNDKVGSRTYQGTGGERSQGNIERAEGETYWSEMAKIYIECHKALKPGGYLIVVVKSYIKNKRKVHLPQQTLKLLIRLGFEPVERIKAMLVKQSVNAGLFGEDVVTEKARKSFFRRLCESKGSPKIDWEEILVVRKLKTP